MTRTQCGLRSPGFGRGFTALVVIAASCIIAAPAQAAGSRVAASQPLVVLQQEEVARTGPDATAERIESVAARRPLTRVRTILPVLDSAVSPEDGGRWVRVELPGRPNERKGWIPSSRTTAGSTSWHISVDLSARWVTVYQHGRTKRRFRAVVGARKTPTPRGRFFIEEALSISPRDTGGPFALAASARSNVLQEFAGGPGQIGLHGTNNLSDKLGSAASHGCIRLSPSAITWMVRRINGGVPLTVSR